MEKCNLSLYMSNAKSYTAFKVVQYPDFWCTQTIVNECTAKNHEAQINSNEGVDQFVEKASLMI